MDPNPPPLDVRLEVYLDGRLIRVVRLGPGDRSGPGTGGAGEPGGAAGPTRRWVAQLPRDGRLRLDIDLWRAPEGDGGSALPDPRAATFTYDATGKPAAGPGRVTTDSDDRPGRPPRPGPEQPPDEPDAVG
jgi:hypothetical protein